MRKLKFHQRPRNAAKEARLRNEKYEIVENPRARATDGVMQLVASGVKERS